MVKTNNVVNVSLKFQMLMSEILQYMYFFLLKNVRNFCIAKASLIFSLAVFEENVEVLS